MNILRSLLYVPADSAKKLTKARGLAPDALIFDLEDAVSLNRKPTARQMLRDELDFTASLRMEKKICVRVNSFRSGLLIEDIAYAVHPATDAIMLPKCDDPDEIRTVAESIRILEAERGLEPEKIKLILIVESALGVTRAADLSFASKRAIAVNFGADDYAADIGVSRTRAEDEFLVPKSWVMTSAQAARLYALDGVFTNIQDEAGLVRETIRGKQLGCTGKTVIHPSQIAVVHSVYTPTPSEEIWARRILDAFQEAQEKESGVANMDGWMVDEPILKQARRVLAYARKAEAQQS
jgi:citrate lyase subunit beta/citryl-CoA lyase